MNRTTVLILSLALFVPTVSLSGQGDEGGSETLNTLLTAVAEVRCAGLNCTFDGTGSSTGDGITHTWDSGEAGSDTKQGIVVSHNYTDSAIFIVTLTVSDGENSTQTQIAHRAHPFGFDLDNGDVGWTPQDITTGTVPLNSPDNLWNVTDPSTIGCDFTARTGSKVLAFSTDGCQYATGDRVSGTMVSDPIDLGGFGLDDPELWMATMWDLQPCNLPDNPEPRCLLPDEPIAAAGEMVHPGTDWLAVQLSEDDQTWETVWRPETPQADWHLLRINLTDQKEADTLRIRFVFDTGDLLAEEGFAGWFVDKIRIDDASEVGPVAMATAEIVREISGEDREILLNGALSVTQGEQPSFSWDVDNGAYTPSGTTLLVQLPPREEDYPIVLTVADETEEMNSTEMALEVPFFPLKADASATQRVFHDLDRSNDTLVVLDGSLSEGDEVIESWNWTWEEDGAEKHHLAEEPVTELTFPLGSYEIFLNITGTNGAWNKTTAPIEVLVNQVPKADATTSQNFSNDWDRSGNATLILNGKQSTDIDGTVESWAWAWINATGEEHILEGETVPVEFPAGDTNITLTVTDDLGGWDETTFKVRVNPIPTANSTGTQTLVHNWARGNATTVQLDGSESTDDRDIIKWNWTWDTGDGAKFELGEEVEIDLPNGTTTVSLNVTDDDGAWNRTSIDILVNVVPIANASNTKNVVPDLDRSGDATVILDGLLSNDLDEGIVNWNWTWTNETGDQFLNLTDPVSAPTEFSLGNTTVTMNVTDDHGAWNTTIFTVRVNDPPYAVVTNTSHDIAEDDRWVFHNPLDESQVTIELNGTESHDLDGALATWEWFALEDDDALIGMDPVIEPQLSVGDHTILFEVTDNDGHKNRTQVPIRVLGNQAPLAGFEVDCVGLSCTFADKSKDPDEGGEIVAWSWLIDGEEIGTEATLSHRFAFEDAGNHSIELHVTDNGGATGTSDRIFKVNLLWSENFTAAEMGDDWIRGGGPGNLWRMIGGQDCGLDNGTSILAFNRGPPDCDYDTGSRVQGHIRSLEIMELADAEEAQLQIVHLRGVESSSIPVDVMRLQVSMNNQHWSTIRQWDSRDSSEFWETDTFDISGFAGGSLWIRFQFDSIDEINNDFAGWQVDQVRIG